MEAASVGWHSLGWHSLGWRPAWFSEIMEAPKATLRWRFPEVPDLGDMTRIADKVRLGLVEAPDILVGGTPCQSFSIAGLRGGMKDKRGQLTLSYIDLLNAMDEVRADEGKEPAVAVWENVPGVLTHKDNPFGCFLAGLVGEDDPIIAPGGKWPNAGAVYGPQRAAAWIVKDSQYFGVAQRRKRVFVVTSARDGFDPGAVLFEFQGVRRDSAPSREKAEGFTTDLRRGFEKGSHWDDLSNPRPTLNQSSAQSGSIGFSNQEVFAQRGAGLVPYYIGTPLGFHMQAFGKYADDDTASVMKARDYKDATDLVVHRAELSPTVTIGAPFSRTGNDRTQEASLVVHTVHGTQDPIHLQDRALTLGRNSGQENAIVLPIHDQATRFSGKRGAKKDGTGRGQPIIAYPGRTSVRRLTPIECERLQGFPDNWTKVPFRKANRKYLTAPRPGYEYVEIDGECWQLMPDGARYQMCGNSMTTNVMNWIGRRIRRHLLTGPVIRELLG